MGCTSLPVLWAIQPERQSSEKALNNSVQHRYTQSATANHDSVHASRHCTWTSEYRCKWDTTQWLRFRGTEVIVPPSCLVRYPVVTTVKMEHLCTSSVFGAACFPSGTETTSEFPQTKLPHETRNHTHTRARSLSLREGERERVGGDVLLSAGVSIFTKTSQHYTTRSTGNTINGRTGD